MGRLRGAVAIAARFVGMADTHGRSVYSWYDFARVSYQNVSRLYT
jgi:hypothetical protein